MLLCSLMAKPQAHKALKSNLTAPRSRRLTHVDARTVQLYALARRVCGPSDPQRRIYDFFVASAPRVQVRIREGQQDLGRRVRRPSFRRIRQGGRDLRRPLAQSPLIPLLAPPLVQGSGRGARYAAPLPNPPRDVAHGSDPHGAETDSDADVDVDADVDMDADAVGAEVGEVGGVAEARGRTVYKGSGSGGGYVEERLRSWCR